MQKSQKLTRLPRRCDSKCVREVMWSVPVACSTRCHQPQQRITVLWHAERFCTNKWVQYVPAKLSCLFMHSSLSGNWQRRYRGPLSRIQSTCHVTSAPYLGCLLRIMCLATRLDMHDKHKILGTTLTWPSICRQFQSVVRTQSMMYRRKLCSKLPPRELDSSKAHMHSHCVTMY